MLIEEIGDGNGEEGEANGANVRKTGEQLFCQMMTTHKRQLTIVYDDLFSPEGKKEKVFNRFFCLVIAIQMAPLPPVPNVNGIAAAAPAGL